MYYIDCDALMYLSKIKNSKTGRTYLSIVQSYRNKLTSAAKLTRKQP